MTMRNKPPKKHQSKNKVKIKRKRLFHKRLSKLSYETYSLPIPRSRINDSCVQGIDHHGIYVPLWVKSKTLDQTAHTSEQRQNVHTQRKRQKGIES